VGSLPIARVLVGGGPSVSVQCGHIGVGDGRPPRREARLATEGPARVEHWPAVRALVDAPDRHAACEVHGDAICKTADIRASTTSGLLGRDDDVD